MSENNPKSVINARNDLARLYANGQTPDPEFLASARQQLATAKIEKAIREALSNSPALHPAQVEYLAGRLQAPGGAE
jgi:hypothetical protein